PSDPVVLQPSREGGLVAGVQGNAPHLADCERFVAGKNGRVEVAPGGVGGVVTPDSAVGADINRTIVDGHGLNVDVGGYLPLVVDALPGLRFRVVFVNEPLGALA